MEIYRRCQISSLSTEDNVMVQELGLYMPYTSDLAQQFNQEIINMPKPMATFNVDAAVAYAAKWACDRNPDYYDYGADCTNFCSQVLEAGGVSQVTDSNDNENNGWWHKVVPGFLGIGTKHISSKSWRLADVFSRYQGVYFTTRNHYEFSQHIMRGDFIAGDWSSDGDWDHTAFVVKKLSTVKQYKNLGDGISRNYYDYTVAQHTNDYFAWTSTEFNEWETVGDDGGTYARVRGR